MAFINDVVEGYQVCSQRTAIYERCMAMPEEFLRGRGTDVAGKDIYTLLDEATQLIVTESVGRKVGITLYDVLHPLKLISNQAFRDNVIMAEGKCI